jgi:site-specific DNA recombinase
MNEHEVAFVCLKGDYDTSTAHGRFIVNLFMSLAQLEREQTSERNRDASLARAQRGLWNGGQILGYDLPMDGKRGTLVPNNREATVVGRIRLLPEPGLSGHRQQ